MPYLLLFALDVVLWIVITRVLINGAKLIQQRAVISSVIRQRAVISSVISLRLTVRPVCQNSCFNKDD
jgi:hypothetical protein